MDEPNVPEITKSQVAADLRVLGLEPGQTLLLHASVKTIGWILGGPRVVLNAMLEQIAPGGTLMMLASWEGNPYRMERWPEAQQAACRAECPPFDPATSPADHRELSILAEYLRTWPGARRSSHPLASFVAVGARASWLTASQPLHYPHGPNGPLARLCAAGGMVVLLGKLFSNLTLLHYAEHLACLPSKRLDHYAMPMLQDGQRMWVEIEEFDTTDGIADFGSDDYFDAIGRAYLVTGKVRTGRVGHAPAFLLDADEIREFGQAWMEAHYQGPLP